MASIRSRWGTTITRIAGAGVCASLALLFGISGTGSGQDRPTPAARAAERLRPPALLVRDDPGKPQRPLRVESVRADVAIVGGVATTTLDITFANDLPRVLEGELVLPLPRSASISRFALQVENGMREAVAVEREKARVAYEEVVRRGVDPGLVEWAAGNAFRTRVYPIPAKGSKRLILGYDETLEDAGAGRLGYTLPLGFGEAVGRLTVNVFVGADALTKPRVEPDGLPLEIELLRGGDSTGHFAGDKVPAKDLRLTVAAGASVACEYARTRPAVGTPQEFILFVAQVPVPEIPTSVTPPARVTLLWDASGSAAARDAERERAFVEALLARLGAAKVRLVVFSNDVWPEAGGGYDVQDGKAPALLERIARIQPDGGTRLSCLDLRALDAETDRFVLVSDGLSTFGEGEALVGLKPVSCVSSAERVDWKALERIARAGAVVNLRALPASEAVTRALEEPLTLQAIEASPDGGFAEIYPRAPGRIDGRTLTLVGRRGMGKTSSKLGLRIARGRAEARLEVEVPAWQTDVSATFEDHSNLIQRLHARSAIDDLMARPEPPEAEIVAIARRHGLVTPFTSLLVLDRLEDYVKHRVVPPKEMQDQYFEVIEHEKAAEAKTREERLASLRGKWRARVEWWKKDFKYAEDFKFGEGETKGRAHSGEDRLAGATLGGGGSPPRPAPAAEPPAASTGAAAEAERTSAEESAAAAAATAAHDGASQSEKSKEDKPRKPEADRISSRPAIQLAAWDPKTPYMDALRKAEPAGREALYAAYLFERPTYAASSAFFLDVADFFFARKLDDLGLRILSNLAELELESAPLLRILGYRLKQAGALDLAIATLERVARLRPEEPQSWRDLGLAEAAAGRFADAVPHLEKVVMGVWDGRFPDVELITLGELNDVAARAGAATGKSFHTLPPDLVQVLDVDLRVILTWDADMCDMDLWVVEPSGEKAFYGHTATTIGGAFGRDLTRGYGPEEYLVKKAMKGAFKIQINYYGNSQQSLAGDTTVQVLVIRGWGRKDEQRTEVTRRLKDRKEVLDIAEIAFPQ